jgi:hypothetical protein
MKMQLLYINDLPMAIGKNAKLQRFLFNGFHLISINSYRDVLLATQKYNNAVWPCDSVLVLFYFVVDICTYVLNVIQLPHLFYAYSTQMCTLYV